MMGLCASALPWFAGSMREIAAQIVRGALDNSGGPDARIQHY